MTHRRPLLPTALALAALALAGCASAPAEQKPAPNYQIADTRLEPTKGNDTRGQVVFEQRGDKVFVTGRITGLAPNQEHGFHVHEKGDCSSPDGMSAGGHFNPTGTAHGQHGKGVHHAGDLPSLKANAQGVVLLSFETDTIRVGSGATAVVGRSLIVHKDPDDYTTQPTGNSGARIACGVINGVR